METRIELNDIAIKKIQHEVKADPKTCPSCNSYFLTDTECESCGYQLNFDLLGEPLGEKSFYTIRESYWCELGPIERNYNFLEKKNKKRFDRYKRRVLFRYNVLLEYFYNYEETKRERRALYLHEFSDLIIELMKMNVPEDEIWKKVDETTDMDESEQNLYQMINNAVTKGRSERVEEEATISSLFSYQLFGSIRLGSALMTTLGLGAIIFLALGAYKTLLN